MHLGLTDSIIYLFGNLFRIYIISALFRVFFNSKSTLQMKKIRIAGYFVFYIINSMAFLYFAWPSSIILLTNIIGISLISVTYTGGWKYRICSVVLSLAVYIICEDLLYYLILLLGIEHILVVGIIAADLMFFMIVLLLKKVIDFNNKIDIPISEWIAVIIIPVLSLVVSTVVLDKCSSEAAVATGEISLTLVNVLVFFLLDKIQQNYQERLDISLLKQQNQAYENQILLINESEERIMSLKHDLKNHFFSLEKLAEKDGTEAIKDYLKKLVSDTDDIKTFAETGNFVIDSLLNAKLAVISTTDAEINVEFSISKGIQIDDKDISVILGNLLDNAITALKKCKQTKKIHVVMRETTGTLFIKVENSHEENIKVKGSKIISTKEDKHNHGIGLKNVQKIVNSYSGTMEIDYDKNNFSVKIFLFL